MSLSCYCDDDYDWWFEEDSDYSKLDTKRSRKCCSCHDRIAVSDLVLSLRCWRNPANDIEERIYRDEVPMATKYLCERCADLYLSLTELGFCITMGDDMRDLVKEYAEMNRQRRVNP